MPSARKAVATQTQPIRLIVGIGNNWIQGFAVVYEETDGTASSANVWFHRKGDKEEPDRDLFGKTRFVDGPSQITWTQYESSNPNPFSRNKIIKEWVITSVEINRKFQTN